MRGGVLGRVYGGYTDIFACRVKGIDGIQGKLGAGIVDTLLDSRDTTHLYIRDCMNATDCTYGGCARYLGGDWYPGSATYSVIYIYSFVNLGDAPASFVYSCSDECATVYVYNSFSIISAPMLNTKGNTLEIYNSYINYDESKESGSPFFDKDLAPSKAPTVSNSGAVKNLDTIMQTEDGYKLSQQFECITNYETKETANGFWIYTWMINIKWVFDDFCEGYAAPNPEKLDTWIDEGNYFEPTGTELTNFFEGAGTSASPFLVKDVDDLCNLAFFTKNIGAVAQSAFFSLENNLDLSGHLWVPIGSSTNPFSATFLGNYHEISGLAACGEANYVGLFGYLSSAKISNLTISGNVCNQADYAGICAGYCTKSTFENVRVLGETGSMGKYCGGIAGYAASSTFEMCFSSANCAAIGSVVGGLVGYSEGGTIKFSFSNDNFINCPQNVGGIVGQAGGSTINITTSLSTSTVQGDKYVGGIWGYFYGSSYLVNLTACAFMGNLVAFSSGGSVLGYAYCNSSSKITDCFAICNATAECNLASMGTSYTPKYSSCYHVLTVGQQQIKKLFLSSSESRDNSFKNYSRFDVLNGGYPVQSPLFAVAIGSETGVIYDWMIANGFTA